MGDVAEGHSNMRTCLRDSYDRMMVMVMVMVIMVVEDAVVEVEVCARTLFAEKQRSFARLLYGGCGPNPWPKLITSWK